MSNKLPKEAATKRSTATSNSSNSEITGVTPATDDLNNGNKKGVSGTKTSSTLKSDVKTNPATKLLQRHSSLSGSAPNIVRATGLAGNHGNNSRNQPQHHKGPPAKSTRGQNQKPPSDKSTNTRVTGEGSGTADHLKSLQEKEKIETNVLGDAERTLEVRGELDKLFEMQPHFPSDQCTASSSTAGAESFVNSIGIQGNPGKESTISPNNMSIDSSSLDSLHDQEYKTMPNFSGDNQMNARKMNNKDYNRETVLLPSNNNESDNRTNGLPTVKNDNMFHSRKQMDQVLHENASTLGPSSTTTFCNDNCAGLHFCLQQIPNVSMMGFDVASRLISQNNGEGTTVMAAEASEMPKKTYPEAGVQEAFSNLQTIRNLASNSGLCTLDDYRHLAGIELLLVKIFSNTSTVNS